MKNYGEEIKYQRLIRNKTIRDVENDTGISRSSLSRLENNICLPNIEFCVRLADYYGISVDELIGREIK